MRPHVEPTVNERELVSIRVPVVRQYGEVAFALVQAMSIAFYYAVVVQGDLPQIQLSQAYLLRVDGASIAADLASGFGDPSRRLCSTSETGEK